MLLLLLLYICPYFSGAEVTKNNFLRSAIFPIFTIVRTLVTYWISRSYFDRRCRSFADTIQKL